MNLNTILTLIWVAISLCIFVALIVSGRNEYKTRLWEFVILALILSVLWPAELCIAIVMLPFYPIYLLRQKKHKKSASVSTEDDADEPDPLQMAEEHPDWTDGTEEYED